MSDKSYRRSVFSLFVISSVLLIGCGKNSAERERAKQAAEQGDFDLAISCWNKVLEKTPDDAAAHQGRGFARQGKDDLDGAIDDLTEAIRLDSSMVPAYGVRGICYQRQGKHDRAIADLTKAIDLDGNYAEAVYRRGVSYANTGMRTEALADYEKAIAICKQNEGKNIRYKQIHQDALEAIAIEKRTLGRTEEK